MDAICTIFFGMARHTRSKPASILGTRLQLQRPRHPATLEHSMGLFPVLATTVAISLPSVAMAGRVASESEACAVLTRAVTEHVLLRNSSNDYYCELHSVSRRYYVFAFRSRHPEPHGAGHEWVGSNLVGWFAVRRSDGAALVWDMAKDGPGIVFSSAKGGGQMTPRGPTHHSSGPTLEATQGLSIR
jgi:hypothetical protein